MLIPLEKFVVGTFVSAYKLHTVKRSNNCPNGILHITRAAEKAQLENESKWAENWIEKWNYGEEMKKRCRKLAKTCTWQLLIRWKCTKNYFISGGVSRPVLRRGFSEFRWEFYENLAWDLVRNLTFLWILERVWTPKPPRYASIHFYHFSSNQWFFFL